MLRAIAENSNRMADMPCNIGLCALRRVPAGNCQRLGGFALVTTRATIYVYTVVETTAAVD